MSELSPAPAEFDPAPWKAFLASVEELNAFVAPQRLCRYQSDILNLGGFEIVSPHTGELLRITRGRFLGGRIAYYMPDIVPAWVMTDNFARKFKLCYLITESSVYTLFAIPIAGSNSPKEKGLISFRRKRAVLWTKLQGREPIWPPPTTAKDRRRASGKTVTMVIGHANFAHHLWNELPALDEWLQQTTDERLDRLTIIALQEPLGPLEEIFPRLSRAKIVRGSDRRLRRALRSAQLVVSPGARFIPTRLRERVRDYCQTRAQKSGLPTLLDDAWPRIWISVRLKSRTAENLDEFLLETIAKFLAAYPSGEVLLDGFSFPIDFQKDPRMGKLRDKFLKVSGDCDAFIAGLLARLRLRLGEHAVSRVRSVSGIDIVSAIALAGRCQYYLCHSGTLQHKVAWLQNIPGMVHGMTASVNWHAEQIEDGVVPDRIPTQWMIRTTEPSSGPLITRNFNYTITNLDGAAKHFVSAIRRRLGAGVRTKSKKVGTPSPVQSGP